MNTVSNFDSLGVMLLAKSCPAPTQAHHNLPKASQNQTRLLVRRVHLLRHQLLQIIRVRQTSPLANFDSHTLYCQLLQKRLTMPLGTHTSHPYRTTTPQSLTSTFLGPPSIPVLVHCCSSSHMPPLSVHQTPRSTLAAWNRKKVAMAV